MYGNASRYLIVAYLKGLQFLREFGIREIRYANYRVAVGEIGIRFLSNLSQNAPYLIPNSHNS